MENKTLTRRAFLRTAAGIGLGLGLYGCAASSAKIQPGLAGDPAYIARLKIKHPESIRILQFTDLHFFGTRNFEAKGKLNEQTAADMKKLVALTHPDLLLVTGDLWSDHPESQLEKYMMFCVDLCDSLGVPWAFSWGNHDQLNDFNAGHQYLTKAAHSLYRGADTNGNYVVELTDKKGTPIWQVICLNTEERGIGPEQQQWLRTAEPVLAQRASGSVPGRFAAFHIPIRQYGEVWHNGTAHGIIAEEPCISEEDGSSLALLKSLGVRACFCGHDHVNDYSGVLDGVDLIYGRATGWGGYGAPIVPKGGKLITLNGRTGEYQWVSVLPDGARWAPGLGERVDKIAEKKKLDAEEKAKKMRRKSQNG